MDPVSGVDADTRPGSRRAQAEATRDLLLRTAERLYAERGLAQVSNRQIVEAAGQANNSALAYHIGTRTDLIHAITRSHVERIAARTQQRVRAARRSRRPRDHVASLVLPYTEYLASLGNPSWCARFLAQVVTDPALADRVDVDPVLAMKFLDGVAAVWSHLAELPPAESALRSQTARVAVIHTCAEQERVAATRGVPADWSLVGQALTDAVTGLLLAARHRTAVPTARKDCP
ncbi:TetR family transcriptional regulator [Rugosimonospora acidiphila]|uniref:TetR family transcriptional regulator n=1 Tax=Rugosimonospora acidiphila TaxID=556531 RepID=A0ABP9S728_9ACTN